MFPSIAIKLHIRKIYH